MNLFSGWYFWQLHFFKTGGNLHPSACLNAVDFQEDIVQKVTNYNEPKKYTSCSTSSVQ